MTNADILIEVNALQKQLATAAVLVEQYQKEVNDRDAMAREYDRQSVEHAANGDYTNSQIAAQRRDSEVSLLKTAQTNLASAQAQYNGIAKQVSDKMASLSPEEKTALQAQTQQIQSAAYAQAVQADIAAKAATYAQTHAKTLTIVGIVLLVLAIVFVAVRLFKNKPAA